MSEKVFAKFNGKIVDMVVAGDYLYVAVDHMGKCEIYEVDISGKSKRVELDE